MSSVSRNRDLRERIREELLRDERTKEYSKIPSRGMIEVFASEHSLDADEVQIAVNAARKSIVSQRSIAKAKDRCSSALRILSSLKDSPSGSISSRPEEMWSLCVSDVIPGDRRALGVLARFSVVILRKAFRANRYVTECLRDVGVQFGIDVMGELGRSYTNFDDHSLEVRDPRWSSVTCAVEGVLRMVGVCNNFRVLRKWGVLVSSAGCEQQRSHSDVCSEAIPAMIGESGFSSLVGDCNLQDKWPLSALVAVEDGTRFMAKPYVAGFCNQVPGGLVPMVLDAGDILVFTGCCEHAGAAYDARNVRMHVHADNGAVDADEVHLT